MSRYDFETLEGSRNGRSRNATGTPLQQYCPNPSATRDRGIPYPDIPRGLPNLVAGGVRSGRPALPRPGPPPQPVRLVYVPPCRSANLDPSNFAHTSAFSSTPALSSRSMQVPRDDARHLQAHLDRQASVHNVASLLAPIRSPMFPHLWTPVWKIKGVEIESHMRTKDDLREGERLVEMDWDYLGMFFEEQRQDYSTKHIHAHGRLQIEFIDAPGVFPGNLIGRAFRLRLPDEVLRDMKSTDVVWRMLMYCNGSHVGEYEDDAVVNYNESSRDQMVRLAMERQFPRQAPPAKSAAEKKKAKLSEKSCAIRAVIEINVGQVAERKLTVKYTEQHDWAPVKKLGCSLTLRNMLHQHCLNPGTTTSVLQKVLKREASRIGSHTWWIDQCANHRMPTTSQLASMVRHAATSQRLHTSPMVALEIMVKRAPHLFLDYNFVPVLKQPLPRSIPISASAKLAFYCIMTTKWALEMAIIFLMEKGMYVDSSNRKKNDLRCPLTLAVTLNDEHNMIPLFAMVSLLQTAEQYERFFEIIRDALEAHSDLVLTPGYQQVVSGAFTDRLRRSATQIASKGFKPRFLMIDQSAAERNGAHRVWGNDLTIRICQFHLMQGIKRWLTGEGGMGDTAAEQHVMCQILDAIRDLQRCPAAQQFDAHWTTFLDIREVAGQYPKVVSKMPEYLLKSWFKEDWREMVCDWGLKDGTRDGPWSTNNFCEAAFRTFDRVILCMRVNKRIDTLIHLIINEYFPLYENFEPNTLRLDPKLVNNFTLAHLLWRSDVIAPIEEDELPPNFQGDYTNCYAVLPLPSPGATEPSNDVAAPTSHFCGYEKVSGLEWCNCSQNRSTGKRCSHLWAMRTVQSLGTVREFETDLQEITSRLDLKEIEDGAGQSSYLVGEIEFWGRDITEESLAGFTPWQAVHGSDFPSTSEWERAQNSFDNAGTRRNGKAVKRITLTQLDSANDDREHEGSAGPEPRGRPAAQQPLPGRSYPKKRPVVGPAPDAPLASGRYPPTGSKNLGDQCFFLSLLHILIRDEEWVARVEAVKGVPVSDAAAKKLFALITHFGVDFRAQVVGAYAEIFPVLQANRLIDTSQHNQQDPVELLHNLHERLDELAGGVSTFADLSRRTLTYSMTCEGCHATHRHEEESSDVFRIFPLSDSHSSTTRSAHVSALLEESIAGEQPSHRPPCKSCRSSSRRQVDEVRLTVPPSRLFVQVSWTAAGIAGASGMGGSGNRFIIAKDLNVHGHRWKLSGVICRRGEGVVRGHFGAIICRPDGSDWMIDDERVYPAALSDAFKHSQIPVLLVYTQDGLDISMRPPAAKKQRKGPTPLCGDLSSDDFAIIYRELELHASTRRSKRRGLARALPATYEISDSQWTALRDLLAGPKASDLGGVAGSSLTAVGSATFIDPNRIDSMVRVRTPRSLWSNIATTDCVRLAESIVSSVRSPSAKLLNVQLKYDDARRLPIIPAARGSAPPLKSAWGKDTAWREFQWVLPFLVVSGHFALLWVIPEYKIVVILDSLATGQGDTGAIEAWRAAISSRVQWEIDQKLIEDDVSNWRIGHNTRAMADVCDFPVQQDGASCGPIAVATAILLVQGIRPSYQSLDLEDRRYNGVDADILRSALLNMVLATAGNGLESLESRPWVGILISSRLLDPARGASGWRRDSGFAASPPISPVRPDPIRQAHPRTLQAVAPLAPPAPARRRPTTKVDFYNDVQSILTSPRQSASTFLPHLSGSSARAVAANDEGGTGPDVAGTGNEGVRWTNGAANWLTSNGGSGVGIAARDEGVLWALLRGSFRELKNSSVRYRIEYYSYEALARMGEKDIEKALATWEQKATEGLPHHEGVKATPSSENGRIYLVGSGPGHPGLLTVAASTILRTATVILSDKLVPAEILALIPKTTELHIAKKFPGNNEGAQNEMMELALEAARRGEVVVRLKQGDPFVYGRGGEEVLYFRQNGFECTLIPGVSSALAGPLMMGVPVTQRGVAESMILCTGVGRAGKSVQLPGYVRSRSLALLMGVARINQIVDVLTNPSGSGRDGPAYPRHLPIAVIERASSPDQRAILSTLENIEEALKSMEERPPGMMLIGWAVLALEGEGRVDVLDRSEEGDAEIVEGWMQGKRWKVREGLGNGWTGLDGLGVAV